MNKRVLVAEDEPLLSMLLEDMLDELGATMVGPYATVASACAAAGEGAFDFALLDLKLIDGQVYPVADAVAEAGKPFAFLTGSSATEIEDDYRDRPLITKPFRLEEIERVLAQ